MITANISHYLLWINNAGWLRCHAGLQHMTKSNEGATIDVPCSEKIAAELRLQREVDYRLVTSSLRRIPFSTSRPPVESIWNVSSIRFKPHDERAFSDNLYGTRAVASGGAVVPLHFTVGLLIAAYIQHSILKMWPPFLVLGPSFWFLAPPAAKSWRRACMAHNRSFCLTMLSYLLPLCKCTLSFHIRLPTPRTVW